ncbi:SMI1/KNR4 family protein [Lysobacter enzymogenes]|uniref:SMI1/KNR4 family protein n=1 Tax=Lysobacter enzymogenes TaxID=69 RepID=UPI00384D9DAE
MERTSTDAAAIVERWKQRTIALAQDPPYVYRDPPDALIREQRLRLTTFRGYTEAQIAAEESRLGVRFPLVYRAYLAQMGVESGDLFRGSEVAGLYDFDEFRERARAMLAEIGESLVLPDDHVVFMGHQGYLYYAFVADGRFDSPVLRWSDGSERGGPITAGFAEWVEEELELMERNNLRQHENGGYYLTLHPGGGQSAHHPALASADHPLPKRPRPAD